MLIGCLVLAGADSATLAAERPNIIFLLADDMRWDAAGFAGNAHIKTPHLDQLAREGTIFRNAFVTTAICAVSRASIFAGQYARRTGINDFATRFSEAAWNETYPAILRSSGYRVGFIGKFGVGNAAPTNTFDFWRGFNGQGRYFETNSRAHLTKRMGESALSFLQTTEGEPFCLSISFKSPHAQDGKKQREFPPDETDEELYRDLDFPAAPSVSDAAYRKLPKSLQQSEGRARWQNRFATAEMRNRTIRDYFRLITGMDREVGRIRQKLSDLGLAKNTIIIFSSDNGFYFGEHGLADKWFMHEESIRVPLVIFDPRRSTKTRETRAFALNIDVAPTILAFANAKIPAGMQGRNLIPLLTGDTPSEWRIDFFYEHHFEYGGKIPSSEGVRNYRWKYVRYTGEKPPVEELFDLETDPHEMTNLSGESAHITLLDQLRSRWRDLGAKLK